MKWGIRRYQPYSDGKKGIFLGEKKKAKAPAAKSLSDAELKKRINRLQMEKQYAQLTAKEKSAGAKFVSDILLNAAKQTATNYVSKAMTKVVEASINKTASKIKG